MLKEFGQDLKKLRELKGISIAEISAESRINIKFLSNLESGNFDFQPETYIRSFIKAYAKALDENENQLLNEYDKAKAGFYKRKKFLNEDGKEVIAPEPKITLSNIEPPPQQNTEQTSTPKENINEPVYSQGIKEDKPDYFKAKEAEPEKEFSSRSITQKVLLIILILAVIAGVYFLIDYLNKNSQQKSDVKPKSFDEISKNYEDKLSGKQLQDSIARADSLKQLAAADSLKLMVVAQKDLTIKVYVDEDRLVEGDIAAKDTVYIMGKDQFRFSATGNQTVELYLNGKYLKKPTKLTGSSIKNLMIKKDGIVTE